MKTIKSVETHVGLLVNMNWLTFMRGEEIVRIDAENLEEAAAFYKVPVAFLEMLHENTQDMANDIIHELHKDLEDIWNKIEGLT